MRTRALAAAVGLAAVLLAVTHAVAAPLDLANPSARQVGVEIEISPDPSVVGASFGAPIPASYAVAGGFGRVTIAGQDYEAFAGIPGLDMSDVVFRIDLATREVVLVSAIGLVSQPFAAYQFLWSMDSTRTSGFVELDSLPPLHCGSQADVDALCPFVPQLCGATCTIVPGAPYDPATGQLNMVGFEHQAGCGETGCITIDVFNRNGDMRLSEAPAAPVVPASSPLAALALAASLLLLATRRLRTLAH